MKVCRFNMSNLQPPRKFFFSLLLTSFAWGVGPAYSISLDIGNPSFELEDPNTGKLLSWNNIGAGFRAVGFNASSQPTDGNYAGTLLANSSLDVPRADLETFLELPLGKLNTLGQGTVDGGSAFTQLVALHADRRLTFDYDFGIINFGNIEDFAFFSIAKQLSPGVFFDSMVSVLANTDSGLTIPQIPGVPETGYRTFSLPILETGIYQIGFGVVNANGNRIQSAVAIDNVRALPEPSPLILICLGLGLLGFLDKYRRY